MISLDKNQYKVIENGITKESAIADLMTYAKGNKNNSKIKMSDRSPDNH